MPHSALLRLWHLAIAVLAISLVAFAFATRPVAIVQYALFFAALVLLASFLRVEHSEGSIGFEASVVFGALILFHDPAIAVLAVFLGTGAHALYETVSRKTPWVRALFDASQLALSYWIVGTLYTSAVARNAAPMAKVSGYILLLVGYLVAHLVFVSINRWFVDASAPLDYRAVLRAQAKTLLLISPIVAIEVMLYPNYEVAAFGIAFLPVLLMAYALRNESETEQQNAELVRRNRELAILTESSTQILSAESDHETLRRLMGLLSRLAKLKACAVVTWEPNPDVQGTVYRFGECLPTDQDVLRWVDQAGFAQSAPSRAFVFQSDMRKFPLSGGTAIQVLIGIQTPEVIYGVLIFETEDLSILKGGALNLLTLLVNQTALSLQDQLLRREMREKTMQLESNAETMSAILEVSNSLIGSFDIDAAWTRIAHAIRKALGFEVVVFALYDGKKDEFVRRAQAGLDDVWEEMKKRRVPAGEMTVFFEPQFRASNSYFVSHTAIRQSDYHYVVRPDDADDSFLKPDEWHENDMLIVPLLSGEQLLGYLSVRDPEDGKVPSIEKVRTLEVFATQAVTALQSSRQYDEIKRLTIIDSLTPAYNHRHFQDALAKEILRHGRKEEEFALAMLDIDNFKRINDTFGHPVGDDILKGLVEELMRNARDSDVVARYGGEEFAIIFPDTPAASARDAANRLRELVENREFWQPHLGRALRITVSVGVASYPRDGVTSADLISRADAALYFAKKNGKNQVAVAGDVGNQESTFGA
jgi:diguanylate cyclase (GGDEF)-like protein